MAVKHLKIFPWHHVLPFTKRPHSLRRDYVIDGERYKVVMRSSRFTLFRKSRVCVECGLEGRWMALDLCDGQRNPHFNLYGKKKGKLILFTRDHIIPKSKGGASNQENYQTMCTICNGRKKDKLPKNGGKACRPVKQG